jgi:hypothetical protein
VALGLFIVSCLSSVGPSPEGTGGAQLTSA